MSPSEPCTGHHDPVTCLLRARNGTLFSGDAAGWVIIWPDDHRVAGHIVRGPYRGPDVPYPARPEGSPRRRRRASARVRARREVAPIEAMLVVGRALVVAVGDVLEVFDLGSLRRTQRVRGVRGPLHLWNGAVWGCTPELDAVVRIDPATWRTEPPITLGRAAATDPSEASVAFNGGFAVRADAERLVVVSLVDGEVCDAVRARWGSVQAVALDAGGARVALIAAGHVRTVTIGGAEDRPLTAPNPPVPDLAPFGPLRCSISWDGDGIVPVGQAGVVRWNDAGGQITGLAPGPASAICEVATGRFDGRITWGRSPELPRTDAAVAALAFAEGTLVVAYRDGTVRRWDLGEHRCLDVLRVPGEPCAIDSRGRQFAASAGDAVLVYDGGGHLRARFAIHPLRLRRVVIEGERVAITSQFYDRSGGRLEVADLDGNRLHVESIARRGEVALAPCGGRVAWTIGGSIDLRRVGDPRPLTRDLTDANGPITDVAFAPDATWLACGTVSGLHLVRVADGAAARFQELSCCGGPVAVSRDGRVARAQSHDSWVGLLDPLAGEGIALYGARAAGTAVAWSPDGGMLASGARDGAVCLFDATTRRLRATLGVLPDGTTAAWSPSADGRS